MTGRSYRSSCLGLALLFGLLFMSGCKEVLYSELSENDANEMVAVLDAGGISAGRVRSKDGIYEITVDGALIASAVTLLQASGYPKQHFESLGDVFAGDELVGSPFNERARFMHAMNEELSRTISEIDSVRSARVQIMIPAQDKYDPTPKAATASVAIMYDERRDLSSLVPVIKTLVAHSVPDLAYDDVAVALFPVVEPRSAVAQDAGAEPHATRAMSIFWLNLPPVWLGLLFGILASAGTLAAVTLFQRKRREEGTAE
jgi:type III secretion protein J